MQGFCVLHAAGNRVGQVDLIPLAVQVYLVPSVVAGAGVALGQCTRDALAAAHCCKQRGEIVADTSGALQGSGGIRDVLGDLAAGDLIRQLVIISITACHVVVDGDNLSLIGLGVLAELSSLSGYRVALGELNFGSGDQIRGVAVLDGYVHGLGLDLLIGRTGNVAVQRYSVLAVALIEREGSILAARAIIEYGLATVVLNTNLESCTRGVVYGNITVGGIAHIHNIICCCCGNAHREGSCCKNCACKTKKPLHIRRSPFGNWLPALSMRGKAL